MVLLKAIEKATEGQEMFLKISDMVLETCKVIMHSNEDFRNGVVKTITDFCASPEFRTVDIVPSLHVMLAQLYTLTQLDNYQQYFKDGFDLAKMQRVFRFAMEEQLRRYLKAD